MFAQTWYLATAAAQHGAKDGVRTAFGPSAAVGAAPVRGPTRTVIRHHLRKHPNTGPRHSERKRFGNAVLTLSPAPENTPNPLAMFAQT